MRLNDGSRTGSGFRLFHQSHHVRYTVPGREPRIRVLLYRDSFANALLKYLVESVDEVVVVLRPALQLDLSLVERYQPDLVIFEFAERFLLYEPELVGGD